MYVILGISYGMSKGNLELTEMGIRDQGSKVRIKSLMVL
jgi:hypothetical protein